MEDIKGAIFLLNKSVLKLKISCMMAGKLLRDKDNDSELTHHYVQQRNECTINRSHSPLFFFISEKNPILIGTKLFCNKNPRT